MNIAMIARASARPRRITTDAGGVGGAAVDADGLATLVAAVEVAVAMAVLYYRTRGNAQLVSGTPAR